MEPQQPVDNNQPQYQPVNTPPVVQPAPAQQFQAAPQQVQQYSPTPTAVYQQNVQPVSASQTSGASNKLAVISLILAFILPFVGFILGLMATSKAKKLGTSKTMPTIAWIIGLLGTIIGLVVGIVVLISVLNTGAVNKKFLNAVFEKDYDTACELWGSETPQDLADCKSVIDSLNEKYSGYKVVKISKTGKDTKLQANFESKTNETTGLGAAVIATKSSDGTFITNFIYGASSFANDEVSEKKEGTNTKVSTLNPLFDSTPVTFDTFKTPCFRYDIPMPHDAVPTGTLCTGENNKFSSADSSFQYSVDTQGYGPYDDYDTLDKCYEYQKKISKTDEYYTITRNTEKDTTWGGQPAKSWIEHVKANGYDSEWDSNYIMALLPGPLDDTGFPGSSGGYIQYQCFVFNVHADTGENTKDVFDKIVASWIWR